jgi:23S rRNA A2030 N6-methylase RlmJ
MDKWEKYKTYIFENPCIFYSDKEQLSHATPFKMSNRMVLWSFRIFKNYIGRVKKVIDLTGSIGGDTLIFSKYVNVNTFEIDEKKYLCLKSNLKLYNRNNVKTFNMDAVNWLYNDEPKNVKNTIIYFDPPWGGSNYINKDVINNLYLGDKEVLDIVNKCFHIGYPMVVIKLPFNYNIKKFKKKFVKREKKVIFVAIMNKNNKNKKN